MPTAREVQGQLDLLLLAVIAGGEQHGYAIIRRLHDRSNGHFELKEGTIYPALHRLEEAQFVISRVVQVDGRQRRLYTLTVSGRAQLAQRQQEWTEFAAGVSAVLGLAT